MCCVLPLLLAFSFTHLPRPDPSKDDLRALQGEWLLAAEFRDGKPGLPTEGWRVEVVGNRVRYVVIGGKVTAEFVVTLDTSTRPRRYFFQGVGDAGSVRGIYLLEDGKVTMCYHAAGGDYPKALDDRGKYIFREIWKRKKP